MAVFFVKGGDGNLRCFQATNGIVVPSVETLEIERPDVETLIKNTKKELMELCSALNLKITNSNRADKRTICETIVANFNKFKTSALEKDDKQKSNTTASSSIDIPAKQDETIAEKTIKVHQMGRSSGFCDIYTSQGDEVQGYRMCFVEGIPHFTTSYGCYEIDTDKTLEDVLRENNVLFFKDDMDNSSNNGSDDGSEAKDGSGDGSTSEMPTADAEDQPVEWTEADEKYLNYLTKMNQNAGIRFNPDQLDDFLKKKLGATFTDGSSLNEATDETIPMTLWVERLNGKSKLIYHITQTTTGKDLYKTLASKGIDMQNVAVKWAGTSSTLAMFDTLYTYACDGTEFHIRPTVMGGGKRAKNAGYSDDNKEKMSLKDLEREIAGVKLLLTNPSSEAVQNIIDRCEFIVARAKANPKCVCDDLIGHLDIATLTTLASGTMNAGTKISDRVSFVIENSMVAEMDKLHEMERQKRVSKKLLEHSVRFAIMTQFADGNNIQWASLVKFMTEKIGSHRPANAGDDRRGCIIG